MSWYSQAPRLPVIDLSLHDMGDPWRDHVAVQLDWAAAEFGAFYLIGHGIEPTLIDSVVESSRALFRMQEAQARQLEPQLEGVPALSMRGDPADYPPFPELPGFRAAVTEYVQGLTGLAQRLMSSLGRALQLGDSYFADRLTGNPRRELHILRGDGSSDGVAQTAAGVESIPSRETGLLTLTYRSEDVGLQVEHARGWIDVPAIPGALMVSIGGMLEEFTSGRYHSASQRQLTAPSSAIAIPFVFKPTLAQPLARHYLSGSIALAHGLTSVERDRAAVAAA